jgi:hypothetical protein
MLAKIARWIVFGALVSVIPLGVSYENLVIKSQSASLDKIMGNGELLIVVWVLCAGALGELLGSGSEFKLLKVLSGGGTLAILIICALMFGSVTEDRAANISINEAELVASSMKLFAIGFLSCIASLALSER